MLQERVDRNDIVSSQLNREELGDVQIDGSQDVDSLFHSRVVDHAVACEESNGKQTFTKTRSTADASVTSHESTSLPCAFPVVLTDAKSSFEEPHRDATRFDLALGQ